MTLERWKQIEEGMEQDEAEGEVAGGHDAVEGGMEFAPAEEADELLDGMGGEGGAGGEGSGSEGTGGGESGESGMYLEGAGTSPLEVEGYELEETLIQEHQTEAIEALEIVHGRDDRVRVWGTTSYPWRTICHLEITARNGRRFTCTGSFIGPRVVLTAGHCMYMHSNGGWARSIRVIPGRNASSLPYGSAVGTRFISVNGWVNSRNSNYDYGVIVLPSNQRLGSRVGWMGLANLSFWSLLGLNVNSSGYPGDKSYGTQWWNSNRILALTSRRLYYRIDTAGGQSGSPVWRYRNGQRHIVGIHTTGSSFWNGATRVNSSVFSNLVNWKNL